MCWMLCWSTELLVCLLSHFGALSCSSSVSLGSKCGYYFFSIHLTVLQVGQLREVSNKVHNAELKLFLEVEMGLVIIMKVVYSLIA